MKTKSLLLLPLALSSSCLFAQDEPQLNIVYILADDLGIGDLGCYGQEKIKTPNIDKMASQGIQFMQHYSGSTVSAPSRCCLLTGLHTGHSKVRGLPAFTATGAPVDFQDSDILVSSVLQDAGYNTAMIGKWGLAEGGMESMPLNRGFDYFFGNKTHKDAHHYYPEYLWENNNKVLYPNNDTENTEGEYSNDLFTDKAVDYINEQSSDTPFFLYLAYGLPHYELTVPSDSKEPYQGLGWDERKLKKGHYFNDEDGNITYAGMVSRLDKYVGEILQMLEEKGLDKNTIVFFSSDNGPEYDNGFFESAKDFRGKKRDLYEGGIRAPFIAFCPEKIVSGVHTEYVSAFWDMFPTFLDIANIKTDTYKNDGISMLPTLVGDKQKEQHDYLYWETNMKQGPIQAVRMGKWKSVKFLSKPMELYDLSVDVSESNNVANQYPKIVSKMERIIKDAHIPSSDFPMDK